MPINRETTLTLSELNRGDIVHCSEWPNTIFMKTEKGRLISLGRLNANGIKAGEYLSEYANLGKIKIAKDVVLDIKSF